MTVVKRVNTKAGNGEMAFVRLEDMSAAIEVVVFPKLYRLTAGQWNRDAILQISGKVQDKEDRILILADEATGVETSGGGIDEGNGY